MAVSIANLFNLFCESGAYSELYRRRQVCNNFSARAFLFILNRCFLEIGKNDAQYTDYMFRPSFVVRTSLF